jgi:hypothetical protein
MKLSEADFRRLEKAALATLPVSADTKSQVTDANLREFSAQVKKLLSRNPEMMIVVIADPSPPKKP